MSQKSATSVKVVFLCSSPVYTVVHSTSLIFTGVLYVVDLRFDNCSFLPLAFLPDGPVHHLPDGRVIMPSAFDYFKLEKDFSYNGQV